MKIIKQIVESDQTQNQYRTIRGSTCKISKIANEQQTRMWANSQPDGRPAEHRWRPLFNATKFG